MGSCLSIIETNIDDKEQNELKQPDRPAPQLINADDLKRLKDLENQLPQDWDVPRIIEWLKSVGLEQYIETFRMEGIDGHYLFDNSRDTIANNMNITNSLHMWSLFKAIDLMKVLPHLNYNRWRWNIYGVVKWLEERDLSCFISPFKKYAIHGGLLFSFSKDEFENTLELGSRYGNIIQFRCLLSCIDYEKQKARKYVSLSSCQKDDTLFHDDGTYELLSEEEDPIPKQLKETYVPEWSIYMVEKWLKIHSFSHLSYVFTENSINGAYLLTLTVDSLQNDLGLKQLQSQSIYFYLKQLIEATNKNESVVLEDISDSDSNSDTDTLETADTTIITEDVQGGMNDSFLLDSEGSLPFENSKTQPVNLPFARFSNMTSNTINTTNSTLVNPIEEKDQNNHKNEVISENSPDELSLNDDDEEKLDSSHIYEYSNDIPHSTSL